MQARSAIPAKYREPLKAFSALHELRCAESFGLGVGAGYFLFHLGCFGPPILQQLLLPIVGEVVGVVG